MDKWVQTDRTPDKGESQRGIYLCPWDQQQYEECPYLGWPANGKTGEFMEE